MGDLKVTYIREHNSAEVRPFILSVTSISIAPHQADFSVGRIGYPNLKRSLKVGEAVLIDVLRDGIYEVRLMGIHEHTSDQYWTASFAVSRLEAGHGPIAGVAFTDPDNGPFTQPEVAQIRKSLSAVEASVRERRDVSPEQIEFIAQRLDDLAEAASRVGRKDWINLAIGTVTNVVVGAAVGSDAAKFLFQRMGQALAWLIGESMKYLP